MSVDLPKAGASSGGSHDLGHSAGAERAMRRLDPDEYRPAMGARRTAAVKVHSHRFTDVRGQWETFDTICFTTHNDLAGSPIDILERKLGDFGRPQAETDQHAQDREVAAAVPSAAVAGHQKALDLVRVQSLGQSRQSPTSHRWHCTGQRPLDFAFHMKKAEQRSQCTHG
jgi:hypothetical protein